MFELNELASKSIVAVFALLSGGVAIIQLISAAKGKGLKEIIARVLGIDKSALRSAKHKETKSR
jgi:hypothetical protein